MTSKEIPALVRYRREQAEQALRDSKLLLDAGSGNTSVNRSYYAMFYGVLALLCTRSMGTSRHSAAIELFDREFVRMGIFDKDLSRWLHEAFELRQRAGLPRDDGHLPRARGTGVAECRAIHRLRQGPS